MHKKACVVKCAAISRIHYSFSKDPVQEMFGKNFIGVYLPEFCMTLIFVSRIRACVCWDICDEGLIQIWNEKKSRAANFELS